MQLCLQLMVIVESQGSIIDCWGGSWVSDPQKLSMPYILEVFHICMGGQGRRHDFQSGGFVTSVRKARKTFRSGLLFPEPLKSAISSNYISNLLLSNYDYSE